MDLKDLAYRAFAAVYNLAALFPPKKDRAVFFRLTAGEHYDSIDEVEAGLRRRGKYDIIEVSRSELESPRTALRFMTRDAFRMGRARYLFLNNNFFPMAYMRPNRRTEVVQLWHGMGAFKKFGFDIPQPPEVRKKELGAQKNIDFVVCSAESIRPIYASAFHLPPEKVITTGTPVQDFYFRPENVGPEALETHRARFDEAYPACRGKYLVFYAPTFRDQEEEDKDLLSHMDFEKLLAAAAEGAGRSAAVLVRLHPNDRESRGILRQICGDSPSVLDLTDYPDGNELSLLSDVMITDYSSICMNNALLQKPVVLYAYDLDRFETERSFYYPYEENAPGPVVKTMDALCRVFRDQDFQPEKLSAFRKLHFGEPDGRATEKLLDRIL